MNFSHENLLNRSRSFTNPIRPMRRVSPLIPILSVAAKHRRLVVTLFLTVCSLSVRAQDANYTVKPDVVYGHKDGMALTFDVFSPKENARGIGLLLMVSGGWVSQWSPPAQASKAFQPLLDAGFTVLAIRHGSSPRYVIPEIAGDIRQALKYVSEHATDYSIDPQKLGVFGFSAGGHLSLLLGTQTNDAKPSDAVSAKPHVAAVVAVFPPTDLAPYVDPASPLRERFPALKFEPSRSDEFSPLMHVSGDDAPTLLVHGDKDELVPIWHSQKIRDAFEKVSVRSELITIEGAAHGFNPEGNKRMVTAMVDWFDKQLGKGASK